MTISDLQLIAQTLANIDLVTGSDIKHKPLTPEDLLSAVRINCQPIIALGYYIDRAMLFPSEKLTTQYLETFCNGYQPDKFKGQRMLNSVWPTKVIGYPTTRTAANDKYVQLTTQDGLTSTVVDGKRLETMYKHLPGCTAYVQNAKSQVQFVRDGKVMGVLMPIYSKGLKVLPKPTPLDQQFATYDNNITHSKATGTGFKSKIQTSDGSFTLDVIRSKDKSDVLYPFTAHIGKRLVLRSVDVQSAKRKVEILGSLIKSVEWVGRKTVVAVPTFSRK